MSRRARRREEEEGMGKEKGEEEQEVEELRWRCWAADLGLLPLPLSPDTAPPGGDVGEFSW